MNDPSPPSPGTTDDGYPPTSLPWAGFLDAPEVRRASAPAGDELVATVLAELDDLDRRLARDRTSSELDAAAAATTRPAVVRIGDAGDTWTRELHQLVVTGTPRGTTLADVVTNFGVAARSSSHAARVVLEQPSLAEALVEKLGGRWEHGSYGRIYRAARIEAGLEPSPTGRPRRSVSGFATASLRGRERRDVLAPVGELPELRGRDELLAALVDPPTDGPVRPTVLVGPGGRGKSTLALAVARAVGERSVLALWVAAADRASLADGLEQVAVHLGVTAHQLEGTRHVSFDLRLRQLWSAIDAQPHEWLLVLDDAGADAVGREAWLYCPASGRVVVTSRHGDAAAWGPGAHVVEVEALEPESGARLLLDRADRAGGGLSHTARRQARRVSELLAGTPLALSSVGTLVATHGPATTLHAVVERLRTSRRRSTGAVDAAYELCLHACGPGEHRARILMRLLACFAADEPLPVSLVEDAPERRWHGHDGLELLVAAGLLDALPAARCDEPAVRLHPAVAEQARRDDRTADAQAALADRAVVLLLQVVDALDAGDPRTWPVVTRLEPHVAHVVGVAVPAGSRETAARALRLADVTAEALMRSGLPGPATTLLDRALDRSAGLGRVHPAMLAARRTRAWVHALDGGGDLPLAAELLSSLLEESVRHLGREHATTLAVQDCLAWVRVEQGHLAAGQRLFVEVLAARRELLGDRHPDTLATRHRLAWIAAKNGDQVAGLRALESVLDDRRALLGPEHLDVFSTQYRLGWALNDQGRHAESERVFRELLDDAGALLGIRHPLTLMVRGRLAWAVAWLNRFDEAEGLYLELLADQEKVLGADHPRLVTTRHYLGALHLKNGHVRQAEAELRDVALRREQMLGQDHLLSLQSRSYHGWALFRTGREGDAERHLEAVLADRTRVLGPRHPDTFYTRHLLTRVLLHRGRLEEAERRLRALHDDITQVLPRDHRTTLRCRVSLAVAHGLQGRVAESEEGLRVVVADRRRVLGDEHRETLAARDQLSWVLSEAGRHAESEDLCHAVLAARRRLLGESHPDTLTSRYRAALLTLRAGRPAEARTRYEEVLVDLRRHLEHPSGGAPDRDRHPDTLRCRVGLLEATRCSGDLEAAAAAAPGLVADLVAVAGEDAIATMRAREELVQLTRARGDDVRARRMAVELLGRRRRVLGHDHPHTARSRLLVDDVGRGTT